MNKQSIFNGFRTSEARWANLGPYYATFPYTFAEKAISEYSSKGDYILDPFAGRGTSLFAAAAMGRHATGIEINPVGYLFAKTKLSPQGKEKVLVRLKELISDIRNCDKHSDELRPFFKHMFCKQVRMFLLAAREKLDWKNNAVDAELMTFILQHLQGDRGKSLGNQMNRVRAMREDYAINWWNKKGMEKAPKVDPFEFLSEKISWRYAKGLPSVADSSVILGDSCEVLETLEPRKYDLLITSPPYIGLANYHDDQRLRLWALGMDSVEIHPHKGRFDHKIAYKNLLASVFQKSARLLKNDARIVIRTDVRKATLNITKEVLAEAFPDHKVRYKISRLKKKSVTEISGQKSNKSAEMDIFFTPKKSAGRKKRIGYSKRLITLPDSSHVRSIGYAQERGISTSCLIEQALENYLCISENTAKKHINPLTH